MHPKTKTEEPMLLREAVDLLCQQLMLIVKRLAFFTPINKPPAPLARATPHQFILSSIMAESVKRMSGQRKISKH